MHLQNQTLTRSLPLSPILLPKPNIKFNSHLPKQYPFRKFCLKCSVSTFSQPTQVGLSSKSNRPFPAEVSRTIMELSSVGTLSTLTPEEGWPLGLGVRFAVDDEGTPVLCLSSQSQRLFPSDKRSSLHVQLDQCGMRTPQCTIQGVLEKPKDTKTLKLLHSTWKNRFGEEFDKELVYVVAVEKDGIWVSSSDYKNSSPDPLRDFAEAIVNEINSKSMEDIYRFCNVYVDLDFQVCSQPMFVHLCCSL
uniref:DUF2470 domain-containing protein n=1 Tax=Rhizophora mucronata TaxID=61149 RepID=A0A2P2JLH5_RHIMU